MVENCNYDLMFPQNNAACKSIILIHCALLGNWSKRRQNGMSTTKTSTNQNVDKPKRRQTETSTDQNVDKPKRRQTETSTN